MTSEELVNNIILNENAYFYSKDTEKFTAKSVIKAVINEASQDKQGRFLLKELNVEQVITEEKSAFSSIAVFKYGRKPSFLKEHVQGWTEQKLAYICIVDFKTHIVIAKRNVSGINEFLKRFSPIEYEVLISLFTDDDTTFEKFSMKNMNISDKSIRQKSVESTDLQGNLSTIGLRTYTLDNLRIGNGADKVSLSINSSRINKFGIKNNLKSFVIWSSRVIERIVSYTPTSNFLGSFATPQDYSNERLSLNPIAVLISLSSLYADYDQNRILRSFIVSDIGEESIDILKSLSRNENLLNVVEQNVNGRKKFKVESQSINDMQLVLNKKTITIQSKKLSRIMLEFSDNRVLSIRDYLNYGNNFIVTFDSPDLVYSNRKLFRDSRLLGGIDSLLDIFLPFEELSKVNSEKGDFTSGQMEFSSDSVFAFVESNFLEKSDYFICDDLGREWADHIGLDSQSVSFYHSKFKKANFSASAFQDIIGQVQKNLGNLSPSDYQWPMKKEFWSRKYVHSSISTEINRLRKGNTVEDAIDKFKALKSYPNLKKKVYLVINFISKTALEDRLNKLQDGESFAERNEVIQILWFVSSLISSCYEVGTEVYICCKP